MIRSGNPHTLTAGCGTGRDVALCLVTLWARYEVCPVKINNWGMLIYLRGRVVRQQQSECLRERANLERSLKNPATVWKVMKLLASKAWEVVLPSSPVAPTAYLSSTTPYSNTLNANGLQSVSDTVNYELNCSNEQGIRFVATWSGNANTIITADWNNILEGKTSAANGIPAMVQQ